MSKERIGVILDIEAEVSKAKGNISSLSKIFDGIGGTKGNQLRNLLSDISEEYEKLADQSGKTMSKVGDFTKAEKSSERLNQLLGKLNREIGNIGKSSKSDLNKFFPSDVADKVKKASDAVKTYNTILENSKKTKGAIGQATKEFNDQEKAVRKATQALKDLENIKAGTSKKQVVTAGVKVDKQNELRNAKTELQNYTDKLQEAQEAMVDLEKRKPHLWANKSWNRSQEFKDLNIELQTAQKNFDTASDKVNNLNRELKNMVVVGDLDEDIKNAKDALDNAQKAATQLRQNLDNVTAAEFTRALDEAKKKLQGLTGIDLSKIGNLDDLTSLFERFSKEGIEGVKRAASQANIEVNNLGNTNENVGAKIQNMTEDVKEQNRAMDEIDGFKNRILQFFSLDNAMQLARRGLQQTLETVKELDKAMTETAVVTDFSVGDMWDALPQYTKAANDLGTTTLGAYETMTLFYQQGLQTNEVFEIGTETMKMARIAGLEYADATNLMTAALRGFNMELNATSATRINDVYSELAAITAADTNEIATAMTKTASIANSANMEFETTAALLSQIIETTREPAETAGTALKTIIARFTEMKKSSSEIVNIDGEEVNVNKVEAALKSAGVALRDVNGEFRDLDDVFLELSSKWNGLDIMTQRYVATMAAGSRQQSRFIAMMQDYDRTIELVDAAYSSSGASQKQFEKTQDSLESKINKLKNAWNEFLMGISNSKVIKAGVDALTGLLNIINKLTGNSGIAKLAVAIGALKGGSAIFKNLFNAGKAGNGLLGILAGFKGNKNIETSINLKPIINESNVVGWFAQFKRNMAILSATANGELLKVNLGFEKVGDTIVATSVKTTMAGEVIETSLSKTGIAALGASEGIEEIGEDGVTSSMSAVAAVEILEQQYKDLEKQIIRVQARIAQGKMNPNVGNYINILEGRKQNIGKDIETLKPFTKESWSKQITQNLDNFAVKLKNLKPGDVVKSFKGLGTSLKGVGEAGLNAGGALIKGVGKALASIPGWGWAAAAAITAVAGGLYALWYNSGLQEAKRIAETDAATLEDTSAQVDVLTTKVNELDDAWESLTTGQEALDGMVQGTIEWTQQVQALNNEIQALLEKYPELYQYLNINKSTGQWTLDEEGYYQYSKKQQNELTELKNRELFEKAISNYSTGIYEAQEKASTKDYIWNWANSKNKQDEKYLDTMKRAYLYAHEQYGTGTAISDLNLSKEELLADKKTREWINNLDDATASAKFWAIGKGNADPRAVLEYYDTQSKLQQQLKAEKDAYVRNYLASASTYGELTQEAVAQTMYDLPSFYDKIEEDRSDAKRDRWWSWGGYGRKTGGAGAKMQGYETNTQGRTVQQIMESRGYELIDEGKNWYKNLFTGEYVNVDAVGGDAAGGKTKTKTYKGEEIEIETWSNEYVRDLGRQDDIRKNQEETIKTLADTFTKDGNLAKVVAGDLSADLNEIITKENIEKDGEVLLDIQEEINNFQKTRAQKMSDLNAQYGNVFTTVGDEYTQKTYEAAQATVVFENSVKDLGTNASQYLTSTFLALKDIEDSEFNLNTIMDLEETDPNYYLKQTVETLNAAGVSASGLQEYVNKIDMSSPINGARQLKQDLEEGGAEAAKASVVLAAAGDELFSVGNQFKEMIASETWIEKTQAGLSEIYKLEGKITSDNIRELAEENSDLAAILDINSLKASGFAEMMEAVEEGTISLTEVTTDLIKIYDGLYYSADLAGEAIARLESVEIGDSDTKIGNIYSESYGAIKDLMSRGAYGDSQIDDYMHQMIGEAEWTTALASAGGDKQAALKDVDSRYGLSANSGNLYGSWSKQLSNAGGSIADGAITRGADGVLYYDLTNIKSTQELVEKIMEDTGVAKDYAETMLADMKAYSKTLDSDLDDLDKRGTLEEFLNSRTTTDKVLNISKAEKAAFAKSRDQSVKEFENDLLATGQIEKFEDRKYSESGYYYSTEEEGNKQFQFTDDKAKQEIINQAKEAIVDIDGAEIPVKITTEDGEILNPDLLNSMIGVDTVREIMLDTNLNEEQKLAMLQEIEVGMYGSTANGIAQGLLGEESIANAQVYSEYMGTEMYNKMGAQLTQAMDLLATHKVTIPFLFSGIGLTVPSTTLTEALGLAGSTFSLGGSESKIVIGGEGTGLSTPFTPKKSSYVPPKTVVDGVGGGNGTGGKGSSYTGGHDTKNDPTKSGSGSGSGDKDDKINYTNPTLENINEKLENLERKREKGEIDALEYEQQKKGLLGLKQGILQADLDKALANSQYKKYFGYDKETDSILLNETEFNKLTNDKKDAVMEEYERIKGINDELNEIEDEIGEYAANANTVDAINAALEAIERKKENKDMDMVDYVNERDALLSKKAIILQATLDDELANNTEKRFFYYDELLDTIMLNEEEFNKLSEDRQEEVRKEYEKLKSINDELNEIEDTLKDMEFDTPEQRQQYQRGEAMDWNTQGELDSINRKRDELSRYDELIGKLPSEMQGPLTLATGAMGMLYEAEESQVLRRREEAFRQELQAKEQTSQYMDNGLVDKDKAYYYFDEATQSYQLYEDKFASIKDDELKQAIMEEMQERADIQKNINDIQAQRSGGIFQKPFYLAEKSAKAMQKAFKNTGNTAKDVKDAFNDLEKALGLSETALDKFEGGLTEAIEQSGLKDKEIKGLGLLSDEQFNKLNNSKLGGFMGDNTKAFAQMLLGEGSTNGMDFANTGLGALSEMFGFTGDLMNFDMMGMGLDMLNTGKGMIEQGMQMVEKIIGYITQAVQVVVDAWTNREDYLYNFLQIIEKHLRDYEKLQREQNQIEKGRYASVDDIKENWDAQWKSLQTQLEEQTERLETRQKELERSRWNPFSLISGWDPSTDTLYENRTVKFAWDLFIGFGSMAPMGLGSLFGSLNQLYEDYDKRVQNSYEDRLAAEQAILDIEDQRLELVKAGSEQATEFEQRVMDAMVQKEQEQIEELTRLNDTISEANSKLIETLRSNLEKMRQERENEKTEEELGEKERRLAYLRQDTSGANMMEIKKLEEQLEEGHESYTDKLIDQKISELEDQNDKAAEQRQKQIDLLQGQLDYAEKYGLYWDKIYGMLYTFDENGNAILNPDNFDLDGNIRKNSELDKLLGTFSDRIGMSAWSTVLDAEELDYLGKYYGAFIEYNGVTGDWKNAWALRDPGAADPNYAYPEQEIPDGLWGALYRLEIALKKNSIHNNPDIINRGGRLEESFKNFFGKLFGNEEWANYEYEPTSAAHVQSTFFAGMKEDLDGIKAWFSGGTSNVSRNAKNLSINSGGTQNYGDSNVNNYFNIGSVGESISLDDMANRVANIFKDMFSTGNNVLRNGH